MRGLLRYSATKAPSGIKANKIKQVKRIAVFSVFLCTLSLTPSYAVFNDLLSRSSAKKTNAQAEILLNAQNNAEAEQSEITGENLSAYAFASNHWQQSKERLEKACRAISSRYNSKSARDILQKLFVIDTQIFRENIKNSAMAVEEINKLNEGVKQGLVKLNRIISAPGAETLDALDKAIDALLATNIREQLAVKRFLAASEGTIDASQASYETLELIPSLTLPALDMMVQSSKQLMKSTQSNSEAFKGLLLNVQNNSEQLTSGLNGIKKTMRETLRFSDHFAIKQFPLINLPTPSREKIYVQIKGMANLAKGVENTVNIGNSQVKNSSQQFSHLIASFVAKASESLKYYNENTFEKPSKQISAYAQNQVSGLFLRVKESISAMRLEMQQASKPANGVMPPVINVESRQEFAQRNAKNTAGKTLPLFLLGAKRKNAPTNTMPQEAANALICGSKAQNGNNSRGNSRNNANAVCGAAGNNGYNANYSVGGNSSCGAEGDNTYNTGKDNSINNSYIANGNSSYATDNSNGLINGFEPLKKSKSAKITGAQPFGLEAPKGYNETVLYSDKEGFSEDGDFLQSELNILTQELGSDFFAGTGISTVSDSASSNQSSDFSFNSDGGNISKSSLLANQETGVEFESDSDEYCDNLNDSENESSGLMKYGSDGMDESELKALMSIDDNAFSFD